MPSYDNIMQAMMAQQDAARQRRMGSGRMEHFPGIMPTPGPYGGGMVPLPGGERPTFPVRPLPGIMPTPGPPGGGMIPLPRGEHPALPGGGLTPLPGIMPTPGPYGGGMIPGFNERPGGPTNPGRMEQFPGIMPTPGPPGGGMIPLPGGERPTPSLIPQQKPPKFF